MHSLFLCTIAGYVANFTVDLRNGTPIADMMKRVVDEFNVPGIKIYADNLFVSIDMLRWCKDNHYNLCGTTRRGFEYPDELVFDQLTLGEFDWRMSPEGFLSLAWKDVGKTKGM